MPAETAPRPKPSRRPRFRYVLVEIASARPPERTEFIRLLQAVVPSDWGVWLTRYDGRFGVLRVRRAAADDLRATLESGAGSKLGGASVRPLLTSGTIAGLERKHPGWARLRQGRRA